MAYMAGDYYQGDYYAGGLLDSFAKGFKKLAGGVLKVAQVIPSPVQPFAKLVQTAHNISGTSFATGPRPGGSGGNPSNLPAVIPRPPVPSITPTTPGVRIATHDPAIDTFLRGGGRFSPAGRAKLERQHAAIGVPPDLAMLPMFHKRRRMNPFNPKALRRAHRRMKGFVKFARRVGALQINTGKGKKIFRHRRKAR